MRGNPKGVGWDVCVEDGFVVCPSDVVPAPEVDDCPDRECKNPLTANPLISPERAKRMTASTAIERDGPLPLFIGL